jgi:hypothetical protein
MAEIRRISGSKPALANSFQDPILQIPNTNGAGGVAQVVECLSSKCETLSPNPSTAKKQKEK